MSTHASLQHPTGDSVVLASKLSSLLSQESALKREMQAATLTMDGSSLQLGISQQRTSRLYLELLTIQSLISDCKLEMQLDEELDKELHEAQLELTAAKSKRAELLQLECALVAKLAADKQAASKSSEQRSRLTARTAATSAAARVYSNVEGLPSDAEDTVHSFQLAGFRAEPPTPESVQRAEHRRDCAELAAVQGLCLHFQSNVLTPAAQDSAAAAARCNSQMSATQQTQVDLEKVVQQELSTLAALKRMDEEECAFECTVKLDILSIAAEEKANTVAKEGLSARLLQLPAEV